MRFKEFMVLFLVFQSLTSFGQDIHFSQFSLSPLSLNAGQTGFFDGNYRLAGNYRGQWAAVPVPYSTFSASADMNLGFKKRKDKIGLGLLIYNDRAGDADFGTSQFSPSFSYIKTLGHPSRHQALSFGVQPGFVQRTINFQKLRFDNQYNGDAFDPAAPSGENFSNSNFYYFTLSAGILYYYKPAHRSSFTLGAGLFNINSAPQSFFNKEDVRLFKRAVFHGQAQFKIGERTDLLPAFQIMQQYKYTEILFGTSLKFLLVQKRGGQEAFNIGCWLRAGDAVILSTGYDYKQFVFGLSYDINYSGLRAATNNRGGLEFAIIYIVKNVPAYINKRICPAYF
jgi:type IX secretion system PorP/SprF family membrane protein